MQPTTPADATGEPPSDELTARGSSSARRIARAAIIIGGLAVLAVAANRLRDEYLSLNPRAASSEGKTWSRCLSAEAALRCEWQGWVDGADIDRHCPGMPCGRKAAARYALRRVSLDDGRVGVVARCVRGYPLDDTWLGVGGEAIHCVDMTWERTSRRSDDGRGLRAADSRCAVVDSLPEHYSADHSR